MPTSDALRWLAGALLIACAAAAGAQSRPAPGYPSRPIRLLVPYVAGSSIDVVGHVLAQRLGAALGQNLFIENRGGAGGAIGADVVAKAAPDGYTVLLTSSSHTSLPAVSKNLPYDTVKDFAPVTLVTRSVGSVLVVHPSLPVRSVRDFVALAKAHPGKLNYGTGGVGNLMHFAAELFNDAAGIRTAHVPYKGAAQVIVDLSAGRIEMGVISAVAVQAHVRAGRLRGLALTAPARWERLADVPTMAEAGVRDCIYGAWYGFWFPAAVPPEYVARLHGEVAKALQDPAIRTRFLDEGMTPVGAAPAEFARTILADIEFHRKLAARIGITPQ